MKVCITYYSRTGNTAKVANLLSDFLKDKGMKTELYRIKPKKDPGIIIGTLKSIRGQKIEIEEFDPDDFDFICIGTPVWADNPHPSINYLIDEYLPNDIKTALFCTLKSDRYDSCLQKIKGRLKLKNAEILAEEGFNMKKFNDDSEDKLTHRVSEYAETVAKNLK
ncbi:MAG: flavodoxin family protein [bacterium]